jgi:glycosyltransferase involved in cell wall biosynthesis
MIKVFFDHQKFTTQRYGGISRYFANVIEAMKPNPEFDYGLGFLYSKNHYIRGERQPLRPASALLQRESVIYWLNEQYCRFKIGQGDFDVLHPTYYADYYIGKTKKPLVVTIHDMTYERLPEYFWDHDPLTYYKRLNIEHADHIIAISETTKQDLLRYSNADPSKISVVYHGIDLDQPLLTDKVAALPETYLLFVGDRGGYKNFYLFLNAFKELAARYPELEVVLTGGGKPGIADREFIARLGLESKVHHVNVTDKELNYLYQNALLFVYPSLYEGFGLPILEAFKAGCPVLLSDTPCFREIGSDATAFFDARSMDALITAIEGLIFDANARKELVERGNVRIKDFPLDKSIAETLDVYRKLR